MVCGGGRYGSERRKWCTQKDVCVKNQSILLSLSIVATALAGCATPQVEDNTPLAETSVVKAKYVIAGYILPDGQGQQLTYTRPDRRTIIENIEYDSWLASQFLGSTHTGAIARLDRSLQWQVDYERESYTECPISGCTDKSVWELLDTGEGEDEEVYDPSGGESCQLVTSDFSFGVEPKNVQRTINGFEAEQYIATWKLISEDENGNQDKHLLTMDFWMSQADSDMHAVWGINGQFQENYLDAVSDRSNPLARYFGDNIYKAVAMVSGDIEKQELDDDSEVVKSLKSIPGYPISIKLEWYANSQTCPEQKNKKSNSMAGFDVKDPLGSLGNMAGDFMKGKAEEEIEKQLKHDKDKPVFSYIYDVTSATVQMERGSRFDVPHGFDLEDRR